MSDNVVFEDYSIQCKNIIKEKAIQFLREAGEEVISMTIRNTVRDTGQTAGSWGDPMVDEGGLAVHMGSNYENAVWEEFGTGEFAEKGNGRKGWWVYVKGGKGKGTGGRTYATAHEAKKAVAILRKQGLDAYYTRGKHARHPFLNAYNSCKSKIIKHAESIFGGIT